MFISKIYNIAFDCHKKIGLRKYKKIRIPKRYTENKVLLKSIISSLLQANVRRIHWVIRDNTENRYPE